MTVSGPVPTGLVRWYCHKCSDAVVDTFAEATVWCRCGKVCSTEPPKTKGGVRRG